MEWEKSEWRQKRDRLQWFQYHHHAQFTCTAASLPLFSKSEANTSANANVRLKNVKVAQCLNFSSNNLPDSFQATSRETLPKKHYD